MSTKRAYLISCSDHYDHRLHVRLTACAGVVTKLPILHRILTTPQRHGLPAVCPAVCSCLHGLMRRICR